MTATAAKVGFQVKGTFYPFVPLEQWTRGDSILAEKVTGHGDELFDGNHSVALQTAFVAVAIWHANPQQPMDRIVARAWGIGLADVEEVGFDEEDEGEQSSPPADDASTDSSSSPESGEDGSESTS